MAFWGVEVRPGKPFTHSFDSLRGRLHISQATLADGSSPKKSLVQCNVGNKSPVLLCALLPEKTESCQLDLEFEEADEVVFSVIGPRSVHLTGYYVGNSRNSKPDDESESFGEDIANSDTMENNLSSDDEYEDSFINDDDPEVLPPSPLSSGADEAIDTKKPKDRKNVHKRLKKRYQSVESDDEETSSMQQHDNTKSSKAATLESDSDDEFPISSIYNTKVDAKNTTEENTLFNTRANETKTKEEKTKKETVENFEKIAEADVPKLKEENKAKQKKKKKGEDKETAINQESDLQNNSTTPSSEIAPDSGSKTKKKRKSRSKEEKSHIADSVENSGNSQKSKKRRKVGKDEKSHEDIIPSDADERKEQGQKPVTENEKKNKKKRSKNSKILDNYENVNIEENNISIKESNKDVGIVSSKSRTLSNGLIIEDLEIGQTHGKIAAPGKKVKIHYSAKLKENGHIIDSNIGKSPFRFRLGDKEVIEGWNLGLDGMRAGDKRRLVVPPTLGYGSQGTEENIPPNSWLVYDIELVSVH
jgi:FK506-binding nuclear protein